MTARELCTNHRQLTRVGFRRHPDGTYFMPGHPGPTIRVTEPLRSIEDIIELAYAWGYCEGLKDAQTRFRGALGITG